MLIQRYQIAAGMQAYSLNLGQLQELSKAELSSYQLTFSDGCRFYKNLLIFRSGFRLMLLLSSGGLFWLSSASSLAFAYSSWMMIFSLSLFLGYRLNRFLMTRGVGLGASEQLSQGGCQALVVFRLELMMSLAPSRLPLKRLGLEPNAFFCYTSCGYQFLVQLLPIFILLFSMLNLGGLDAASTSLSCSILNSYFLSSTSLVLSFFSILRIQTQMEVTLLKGRFDILFKYNQIQIITRSFIWRWMGREGRAWGWVGFLGLYKFYLFFMRIQIALTTWLIVLALVPSSHSLDASLRQEQEKAYPHIAEYIDKFELKTNDLENALNGQLHTITLGEIKTSYAHLINSTVSISHYGSEKKVEYLNPLKVRVSNDTFSTFVMFNIHVLHIVGGKNYSCNVSLSLVRVSYTKELNLQTGDVTISAFNSTYSSGSFNQPVCKETESGKDKVRIDQAVNSTQGSSIFIQLQKHFSKMQGYFTDNAKDEHLSHIYQKNPYTYRYDNQLTFDINVGTIDVTKFGDSGVVNNIAGTMAGTSHAAIAPPDYQTGYTSFYSKEFFQNMLEYFRANHPSWKNIKLNGLNMRTRVFKFRLIDFEYLIPAILQKYPQKYMSDIQIQCNIQKIKDFVFQESEIAQYLDWRCTSSLDLGAGNKQLFLNFMVTLKHKLKVWLDQSRLFVYVDALQIIDLNIDIIADYTVTDPFSLSYYISEGLFQFRSYTAGTNLKISSPNQQLKIVPDRGIWVG